VDDPLALPVRGFGVIPEFRQIGSQGADFGLLLFCDGGGIEAIFLAAFFLGLRQQPQFRVITTGLCVASDQRLPCEPTGALPQTPPHLHLLERLG